MPVTRSQSQSQNQSQNKIPKKGTTQETQTGVVKRTRTIDMSAAWRGAALKRQKKLQAKLARYSGKVAAAARRSETKQTSMYCFFGKMTCNMIINAMILAILYTEYYG